MYNTRSVWFDIFSIFKCNYNAGVTIIISLFEVVKGTLKSDIYVHILNLIKTILKFCEDYKKYWTFTQSISVEIPRKRTFSADF